MRLKVIFLLVKNECLGKTGKSHEYCDFVTANNELVGILLYLIAILKTVNGFRFQNGKSVIWGYVEEKLNGLYFNLLIFYDSAVI